jgi:hypothetical protein
MNGDKILRLIRDFIIIVFMIFLFLFIASQLGEMATIIVILTLMLFIMIPWTNNRKRSE